MITPEAWGVKNLDGIYLLDEETARAMAAGYEDCTLVCKVKGEWIEVAAGS